MRLFPFVFDAFIIDHDDSPLGFPGDSRCARNRGPMERQGTRSRTAGAAVGRACHANRDVWIDDRIPMDRHGVYGMARLRSRMGRGAIGSDAGSTRIYDRGWGGAGLVLGIGAAWEFEATGADVQRTVRTREFRISDGA